MKSFQKEFEKHRWPTLDFVPERLTRPAAVRNGHSFGSFTTRLEEISDIQEIY